MKSPWIWIAVGAVAVLIVAPVWVSGRVRDFLEGGDFHKMVERHAGEALRGEVELAPLGWSGPGAFSESVTVRGNAGSGVETIEAAGLRADWNWRAFFSGAWRVEEISIESLSGKFGTPTDPAGGSAASQPSSPARWWSAFLPKRFELGQARIRRVDLDFGGIGLRDSALNFRPEGGAWIFSGTGGTLSMSRWPSLGVESYRARWGGDRLRIEAATLRAGSGGRVEIAGDWPHPLDLEWAGVELADLLPEPWKARTGGNLSGTGKIDAAGAAGNFQMVNGTIRGAEWLEELATITGRGEFRRLAIQKATGDWECRGGVWVLRNLFLESEGLLRIEGSVRVSTDGSLSGEVRLGVVPALLRPLPGAREKVFTEARDGFVWTPVSLGGTLDAPSENLGARLASAAAGTALDAVRPALQAVPEGAGKAIGETIDTLFDILGR